MKTETEAIQYDKKNSRIKLLLIHPKVELLYSLNKLHLLLKYIE